MPGVSSAADQIDATFVAVQSALVGEYSLERELGRGGMGIVYLAREVRLDRLVAIKVLPAELASNDELRTRFMRESQTAARLSHPNIVPIHRVGEAAGFVYFVMGYVEGETLTQRVKARGPFVAHEGVRLIRECAWALAYAHARGIVHRDVKPDNILIEQGSGRAMLTDFGIAHVQAAATRTEAGLILGTAHYMSPEQAAGEPLDGRSDLYSLGIVSHFMLAGSVPFDDPSVATLLAKHITQPAPSLSSVAPAVPRAVCDAIDRLLAKSPDDRFATGEALADALGAASEPPREVPAAIRVWIAKGQQNRGMGLFLSLYLSSALLPLAFMRSPWYSLLPVGLVSATLGLPLLLRTRRVLREGYTLADLRAALRLYWARRREELLYEHVDAPIRRWTLTGVAIAGWVTTGLSILLPSLGEAREPLIAFSLVIAGTTTPLALIDRFRQKRLAKAGSWHLRFWNSGWAERLVRLASIGLRRIVKAPATPQLTEMAIGRATEALFESLPSKVKRDLKALPATVRALETEAQALREQIAKLERHRREMSADPSRTLAASSGHQSAVLDERHRVDAEIAATREQAQSRLADTIGALESIRLGLLRLQLGSAPVESVTSALEAAQRVADDVGRVADAEREVEATLRLRPSRPLTTPGS